jgi:hypothetical protein
MVESSFEASFELFYCLFPLPPKGEVDKLLNNQPLYISFENLKILNTHFMGLIKHGSASVLSSLNSCGGWMGYVWFNSTQRGSP